MPNQYARVKNAVKGEEDIQDQRPTYGFIDDFLEDATKSSNLYEEQDADYEPWNLEHSIYTSISLNSTLHNMCMSLLFLPENHHISILDGGAGTCVLGKGRKILSIHNSRRANIVSFDHEAAVKKNLPIVSANTAVDLSNGQSILLVRRIMSKRLPAVYKKESTTQAQLCTTNSSLTFSSSTAAVLP
jgi:hypothetical protein